MDRLSETERVLECVTVSLAVDELDTDVVLVSAADELREGESLVDCESVLDVDSDPLYVGDCVFEPLTDLDRVDSLLRVGSEEFVWTMVVDKEASSESEGVPDSDGLPETESTVDCEAVELMVLVAERLAPPGLLVMVVVKLTKVETDLDVESVLQLTLPTL